MGVYFINEKTGKRYDVVRFDPDKGEVVLKGQHAEFTEKFDRAKFQNLGYDLRRE